MYALCLFAGIAGIELGLSLVANVTPVCFVEQDKFCQDLLRRRHPDAWIWDDVNTFPAEDWAGIDILTAGFPCQPWSYAGSREGTADERWLWARIVEVIGKTKPKYVLLENVPGLLAGKPDICVCRWNHRRRRLHTNLPATREKHPVADSNGQRLEERTLPEGTDELPPAFGSLPELGYADEQRGSGNLRERASETEGPSRVLADSPSERGRELPRRGEGRDNSGGPDISVWPPSPGGNWSSIPPEFWPTECCCRGGLA